MDLLATNANIATMDPQGTVVQAGAVKDGRIVSRASHTTQPAIVHGTALGDAHTHAHSKSNLSSISGKQLDTKTCRHLHSSSRHASGIWQPTKAQRKGSRCQELS